MNNIVVSKLVFSSITRITWLELGICAEAVSEKHNKIKLTDKTILFFILVSDFDGCFMIGSPPVLIGGSTNQCARTCCGHKPRNKKETLGFRASVDMSAGKYGEWENSNF